jgi:conserved oligomeric Golgi complex subunit 2
MNDSTMDIPTAMSTSALESKLKDLKEKSNKHSQLLTAKLASSQSGQNLLHIGTSLSTLPPDLHSLLTQLHPVLSSAEVTEKHYLQRLERVVKCGNDIRLEERRVQNAKDCALLYQDLLAAEGFVKKEVLQRRHVERGSSTEDGDTSIELPILSKSQKFGESSGLKK